LKNAIADDADHRGDGDEGGDAGDQHQPTHLGHHTRGLRIEWLVVVGQRIAHGFDAGAQRDIGGGRRGGGERLDRVLAARVAELSRSRHKALILAGRVAIDGATIRDPGHRVNAGATIVLDLPPAEEVALAPETIPLDVVFEDADLIVIDKPAGLVVHPAAGNWTGTLVNALVAHCGESLSGVGGVKRPGIVHRLDKDTSGLMVVAKTDRAHRALSRQFADHGRSGALRRGYLAFVWGVPERPRGTIDKPIGRHPHARQDGGARGRPRGADPLGGARALFRHRRRAGGEPPGVPAGDPGARTRSAFTLPRSGTHCWGTTSTGPASRPRPISSGRTPGTRSTPLAGRRCMPIY
jgi:Pseudouridylate synthases, 23S RNA-specific